MSPFSDPRWSEALGHLPDYLGNHVRVSVTALALGLAISLPRAIAARLIAEGRARMATPDETCVHQETIRQAVDVADKMALAERVQVAFVSDVDLDGLRQKTKSKKG